VRKYMPGKALPFKPEDWPEVVKTAAGMMTDNHLIPACTLIIGLPKEDDEDVIETIELIDDLKDFVSLIVPLFFVPLGQLRDEEWFTIDKMTDLQQELLIKCLQHDLKWVRMIMHSYFHKWYGPILSVLYRFFVWLIERRAKKTGLLSSRTTIHRRMETAQIKPQEVR
ncbi:radical SAM protein, partial [Candidatus Bathyarchaeota archaeon]|nr:radical SAM protein [Candidatus Bathyarchaeota archaeon]